MLVASIIDFLLHPDLEPLLEHGSWVFVLAVAAMIFAESGLLVGVFLPGDSLLFSAGLVVALGGRPNIVVLVAACMVAAVLGDQVGYAFGARVGPSLFSRPDSRVFKQANVTKAHEFFERHGPRALVLARFVPIVRTFTPILAGVAGMRYRTFATFNVVGGVLWACGATLLGYGLGKRYPELEEYLTPVILVIVAVSVLPIVVEVVKARRDGGGVEELVDELLEADEEPEALT